MKKIALVLLFLTFNSQASVLLRDVGVIGLMSHDIFAWDRKNEVNTENGRLDLSTIFDWDNGKRWEKGGNPKNAENSPVYTITMILVNNYKKELKTSTPEAARKNTVILFHHMIKHSYERLSGQTFPVNGRLENVNNIEQAALRGFHDILPGRVKLFDRMFKQELVLTDAFSAKHILNEKELNQELKTFDGDYDYEYKNIKIPFTTIKVNLKEVDKTFIEKFSPYKQADMLNDLAKVGRGELLIQDVFFMTHIEDLVSKAICPQDNKWMPQGIFCY